jgi:hypothetical protein
MNKKIISEVNRISTLMGVKPLITEQAVPRFIKSLLNLSDDVVKKFYKTGDNVSDDLLRKVRNGESLSDDAIELLLRNIDFQSLSKIIIDGKWLGSNFDTFVDSIVNKINENPKNTQAILDNFDTFIDNIPYLSDAPDELMVGLKNEIMDRIIRRTSKIFDINNWDDLITLTDNEIQQLLNLGIWDKVVLNFESLFKPTQERLKSIQQLAYNIQTTTDADLQTQLTAKLKKELEWLYKKNTNNFVAMKKYFDLIGDTNPTWKSIWNKIKSQSDGGWDFYKSFGSVAQYVSTFNRIWGGITSDLKVLIETEKKIISKTVNKIAKKEITKVDLIGNFWENFKTGSRRGFPKMSNEKYQKIIQQYGPTGAKASYFRDLVVTTLKWNFYVGFLVTLRNFIANSTYEDDIQRCVSTNNIKSKECTELNKNYFTKKMAEWSLKYRENPESSSDFIKNWILEIFGPKSNLPNIVKDDLYYKKIAEISTLDPGLIGEAFNMFASIINLNDNPLRKKELLDSIDKQIKLANEKVETAKDKVDEAINNVDVNDIVDTELGFKAFIVQNWIDPITKKSQLTGNETFTKDGDIYVVDVKGVGKFKYKFNGTTFTFIN